MSVFEYCNCRWGYRQCASVFQTGDSVRTKCGQKEAIFQDNVQTQNTSELLMMNSEAMPHLLVSSILERKCLKSKNANFVAIRNLGFKNMTKVMNQEATGTQIKESVLPVNCKINYEIKTSFRKFQSIHTK